MGNKSEEKMLELEVASDRNKCLIPTLFQLDKPIEERMNENDYFTVKVGSFCEEYILKIGMIFNAVLPAFGTGNKSKEYTYEEKANKENKIVFKLPSEKKTKMLFMRLCESKKGNASNDDIFVAICYKNKKYVKFNMSYEKYMPSEEKGYEGLWISKEEPKLFCLYDDAKGCSLLFECWTEYLPIPGESDGAFAYVDGSGNPNDPKKGYGAGYVISNSNNGEREIRFGHTTIKESGSNYDGEMEAVTNVLKNILENIKEKKDLEAYQNLKIYFDNTCVGYYPAKFHNWLKVNAKKNATPHAVEYCKTYVAYIGLFKEYNMECNIEFIHVDAHFGVFGNDMADRLAQINDSKLKEEYVEGYESAREKICPEGGQFSNPVILLKP